MSESGLGGWTGKLLRVDLTRRSIAVEDLDLTWARDYVGGRGVAARYLFEEVDPRIEPLAPENKLIFATGPLTGTNASCGARYMVVTKGPLTGAITTSNSGGRWGPELKFAGYDMILFEGRSERPVYLWIFDDQLELRPAEHLWGKGVFETEDALRSETGVADCAVAAIGPAGENRVLYAAIVNEKFRAAGRSGVGAVMGSKNLKAIAVRGTGAVEVARPEAMMRAQWEMKRDLQAAPLTAQGLPEYGTLALMNVINEHGALPTNNGAQDPAGGRAAETSIIWMVALRRSVSAARRLADAKSMVSPAQTPVLSQSNKSPASRWATSASRSSRSGRNRSAAIVHAPTRQCSGGALRSPTRTRSGFTPQASSALANRIDRSTQFAPTSRDEGTARISAVGRIDWCAVPLHGSS